MAIEGWGPGQAQAQMIHQARECMCVEVKWEVSEMGVRPHYVAGVLPYDRCDALQVA